MRALITNDDGFDSPGLKLLREFVLGIGFLDTVTVVPRTNRSASSHAVSLGKKLKIEEIAENVFSVDGTPADCVITAFYEPRLTKSGIPDVVFSGVNIGANLGIDTLYSGTIAAAMQGMLFGTAAFAFSQFYSSTPNTMTWNIDSQHIKKYILLMLEKVDILRNCVLNINIPECKVIGVKHVPQYMNIDVLKKKESVIKTRPHEEGNEKYITIETTSSPQFCQFLKSGYVTVTPVGCDLTNYAALKLLDSSS
ncbi:5'/3'-nucleotidase SurE [Neorickettsia findlayensis]|uniref:5'-nucleotidase SurE n=1 Tax=Neorickettsia findlayensis TaxID=2686014 RepID=A0A6P1G9X7_9RICK|nr:5'/3'-nucleotidase SurE [Neorickettsia findlayensis]QHD65132.1 5'/3'-nucleotidase SurE [Neorickettsia findlayensis]